jgi:hypothetical protein
MQRTDVHIGGLWSPACGALRLARPGPARFFATSGGFWINLPGRYDRLGSRLLAGSLGRVAFESAPSYTPGRVTAGEGWVIAARKPERALNWGRDDCRAAVAGREP